MTTTQTQLPTKITTTRITVPASTDGPAVPALIQRSSEDSTGGWIVWAHGGSWRQGSTAGWSNATGLLAALSGKKVLSLDYRLAPTHRHPAALLDMLTAVTWLSEVYPGEPVIVGGDSAGGTIAAVAALAARDRGHHLQAQLLAYPPIDPDCRAGSYHADPDVFPQPGLLREAWRLWAGPHLESAVAVDGTRLLLSPQDADTLAGVAPAVLVVGENDPVRDDVAGYAAGLRAADVDVDHRVLPGIGHADVLRPDSAVIAVLAAALSESSPEEPQ